MNRIALEPAMVPASIRGSYTGKRFFAVITNEVTVPADAGLWSGGCRDVWDIIGIDGQRVRVGDADAAFAGRQSEQKIELIPGAVVRRHSQGMYSDVTFYIHPDTANKMLLAAPKAELTANETEVLKATKKLKSFYNGKDRYQMRKEDWEYAWRKNPPFMSRDDWEFAKHTLYEKGLLTKAGAITVKGRNAVMGD